MTRKRSGYKIGDTWKCKEYGGRIGTVWLRSIEETFEVWMWSCCYSDGSGLEFDWTTNRADAVANCPVPGRYTKVKNDSEAVC